MELALGLEDALALEDAAGVLELELAEGPLRTLLEGAPDGASPEVELGNMILGWFLSVLVLDKR